MNRRQFLKVLLAGAAVSAVPVAAAKALEDLAKPKVFTLSAKAPFAGKFVLSCFVRQANQWTRISTCATAEKNQEIVLYVDSPVEVTAICGMQLEIDCLPKYTYQEIQSYIEEYSHSNLLPNSGELNV